MKKITSVLVQPVQQYYHERYPVKDVGILQVDADNKILTIYDDKGNSKIVSAADSTITSGVINNLIDLRMSKIRVFRYKGIKNTYAELIAEQTKQIGDVWQVKETNKQYVWNGDEWVQIGFDFDLQKIYDTIAVTSGILQDTKADKATTLAGYNISDAYTKLQADNKFLSSYTEVDPIYSADKPNLALKSQIPTKVSQLDNDIPYLSAHQSLDGKVDKVEGKSLISDSEITRLATVTNYDDTTIKNNINTISGTYLKNIKLNGQTGTVENNIASVTLPTCNPFPSSFLDGIYHGSNVTTEQFCESIMNTSTATVGMVYLGGVSLTDMPFDGNAEVIVRIMTSSKVIVLQMFSTNIPCNHWYAMYYYGMETGTSECPWQGIMSINGSDRIGYAPNSEYQAASKKYVDEQISAKFTSNVTQTDVQQAISNYLSTYTEVDPIFTAASSQFVTKAELPELVSSLISGYVKQLNENIALTNALSSLLVSNNVITTTALTSKIDESLELNYQKFDELL